MISTMTTDRGCSILLLSFTVLVLLFCQSSARVAPTQRGLQRGLQTHNNQEIIRGELIHREHQRSPLCHQNATQFERIGSAITRSLHRENQISSRRKLAFSTPIGAAGNTLPGEYVMDIFLGTPPQRFIAIVDTGSDLVWVQCAPCIQCFAQPDPLFYPSNSTSYVAVPCTDPLCNGAVTQLPGISCDTTCHFQYSYLDKSSIAGYLSKETLYLTNTTGVVTGPGFAPILFGCMNNDTGTFTSVDGLVGFGMGPLSLPSQISGVERATFSYCLVSISAATDFTSSLFFGTNTASVNGLPLVYTPLVQNTYAPSFYFATMTGITVNGVDLGIPVANFQFDPAPASTGGVLFDSGTTLTLLRTGVVEYVLTALQAAVTATQAPAVEPLQLCYQLTAPPPSVTMSFWFLGVDGTAVEYAFDAYNIWLQVSQGVWCAAIRASADQSIIGNIAQANHFIETDIVGLTIGWLSVDCLTSF